MIKRNILFFKNIASLNTNLFWLVFFLIVCYNQIYMFFERKGLNDMSNYIAQWFAENLQDYLPSEVIIAIFSMSPIMEFKGGFIAAALLGVNMIKSIIICFTANVIPVPFVVLFINKIFDKLKNTRLKKIVVKTENKILSKKDMIDKYGFVGLVLLTGIPIPGTGAWTASIAAALFKIPLKKAIVPIIIGLLSGAAIMTFISFILPNLIITYFAG